MTIPRLHVDEPLAAGRQLALDPTRVSYLVTVLRRRPGDSVLVFNGGDGEWEARLVGEGKRRLALEVTVIVRSAEPEPGPALVLAPMRRHRLEWLVEKAVELGVAGIHPVLTERTVARLDNPGRLRAIATEAAEQSGRLHVPPVEDPVTLVAWLETRTAGERVLFADEAGGGGSFVDALPAGGVLIGPEGGFTPRERGWLHDAPGIVPVGLGPRILRAETACLAALSAMVLWRPA